MKKTRILILFVLCFISFSTAANAANVGPHASSSTDYATCMQFADGFKLITYNEGYYYYKSCWRATCSNGSYNVANMVQNYGYQCQNGNRTPYFYVTSDGCVSYKGSCGTKNSTYCTRVYYVDCNRTSSGNPYTTKTTTRSTSSRVTLPSSSAKPTTKSTSTKKTTSSTKKTTTKSSTKKTTTKSTTSSKKTTTTRRGGIIITPTTSSTTSSTTSITLPTSANNSKSTDVKTISINDRKINVTNTKNDYGIKLPEGINNVDVEVELEYESAHYTVTGNENIPDEIPKEGVDIVVTIIGADTEKREITINVKRLINESNDCHLANIYIEDYLDDFSKNVMDYTIKIPKNVKSLNPEVVTSDDGATYEIDGDENLKNNSKIKIEVTAENGEVCVYTITVKKESNTWKYILIIMLLLIILGIAGILLMKYLKKSKGTYKYE